VPIVEGDQHDSLSATYQTLEVARLNDALRECGVLDVKVRRAVCETYFFNSGYFLDGCWFAEAGKRLRAGVYFAELDRTNAPTGTIYLPDPAIGTMFHEYAHGAAAWLFDEHNERADEIEVGDAL
jgi:hypothetical protein